MGKTVQMEPLPSEQADWIAGQNGTRYEQLLNVRINNGPSANFRTRMRNTFKFFDTLPDAREWAEQVVRRDFPEISVEEDVGGVWELREIHTTGGP